MSSETRRPVASHPERTSDGPPISIGNGGEKHKLTLKELGNFPASGLGPFLNVECLRKGSLQITRRNEYPPRHKMSTSGATCVLRSLPDLVTRICSEPRFAAIIEALHRDESGTIDGAWGSACALAAAGLVVGTKASQPRTLLFVLPRIADVDDFAVDLMAFLGETPVVFPAWESLPTEHSVSDQIFGARLRVLSLIESPEPPSVIVTSIPALLQPVPSRHIRGASTRQLKVGETLDLEELLQWLVDRGFERESAIERPGEFALHGGILDVFPPDAEDPFRIELFGDEIDSIRTFDSETQRKLEDLTEAQLTALAPVGASKDESNSPAKGTTPSVPFSEGEHFVDLLPLGTAIGLIELPELIDEGKHYLDRLDNPRGLYTVESTMQRCTTRPTVTLSALASDSVETTCHLQIESIERFTGPKAEVLHELATVVGREETVLIACHNVGEQTRLKELFEEEKSTFEVVDAADLIARTATAERPRVVLTVGSVARGFRIVSQQLIVLSDHELFSRTDIRRGQQKKVKRVESRAIDSFLDLNPNDYVVHLTHGIGRFRGMELVDQDGIKEEHLLLEFRDRVRIYVPVSLIHLVQKYVGAAKTAPTLSKIGGSLWSRQKQKVSEAIADMASDMLRLQADRATKPGLSCPPDSHLQKEFEAAFPYIETADQVSAIHETKQDQEQPRPMDRLVCGDVGFGKTEIAMRAAFKAVDAGYQVAILVPTTVLCEQHYRSFRDRMAEFPVRVESLSRFRTKADQKRTLELAAEGKIDIVIGTHRIVQKDVKFKNLGLLVIDEEQRFGVDAKEMLKRLRLAVDVLTLSATPIPRTLHLSLLGIRDISSLTTPPRDRVAIETRIVRWDGDLIRHAVMREMNRGGQVYFVHNRVHDIEAVRDRLKQLVPEARIVIAHGQMSERELERSMLAFVRGNADILLATTIIESGLDIASANTMFIDQAQWYGLADLHQLRGRVGRYKHRAYCYLILDEKKPVSSQATKRLKAIEEYSELGAGFKIAMRDLEIRGAGNILGTEQSGHISVVGYELYCQLLEAAVRKEQGLAPRDLPHVNIDLPFEAYIPNTYIPPGRQKIDVYRKLSTAATFSELEELTAEIRDRFGPIPEPAERLLKQKSLELMAWRWGIDGIRLETEENRFAVFSYRDDQKIHDLCRHIGSDLRLVDRRNAYLLLARRDLDGASLIDYLQLLLK
ncbi:MAG: transcription-repair coupling factor [Planctomycetaceae bacterium]